MSKITDLAALTSPDNSDLVPVVDIDDTTMAATGTDKKATLSVVRGYVTASGDTTGALDYAAIQAALNTAYTATPYGRVYLGPYIYYTNHPLVIPPGVGLLGVTANEVAEVTGGGITSGSVVLGSASFTQGSAAGNAMVLCLSQADGGYASSVTSEEQKINGIVFDGGNIPGSVVNDGLQIKGGCRRIHVENVLFAHMNGNGVNIATGTDGNQCNATRLKRVGVRYALLTGFNLYRSSDGTYVDCLAENCTGDGYVITNASNGGFFHCRSEHNANGFTFNGQSAGTGSGGAKFVGCSTDRNNLNGWNFTTAGGPTPVILSGCYARRDGANSNSGGGSYAGINITDYPSAVIISGCTTFPGVNDDGTGANSPEYGLRMTSNTGGYVVVSGCYLHGDSQAVQDDSSGTVIHNSTSLRATGTTSSPVYGTAY